MRRAIVLLLIFLALLILPFIVLRLVYYELSAPERREVPEYTAEDIAGQVPTPDAGTFIDVPELGEGHVLLDYGHENDFDLAEISSLDGRLAARGYELVPFEGGDLRSMLRSVDAYIVIAPMTQLTMEEVRAVSDFVDLGGRILLVGDPTRFNIEFDEDIFSFEYSIDTDEIPLNSLANEFDLIFSGDYLYNTVENEGNFRNIRLQRDALSEGNLTADVENLAFFGSHSIQVGSRGQPILTADDNTWSSATDRAGGLVLAALGGQERVLAIGDIDFLSDPYHTMYDNGRFIANIADFLTLPQRDYNLSDFPFFYGSDVDLVYTGDPELGPDAFDEIVALQKLFASTDRNLTLADEPKNGNDALFLGVYNQAEEIVEILDALGITLIIDPPVLEEPEVQDGENGGDKEIEEPETDAVEDVEQVDLGEEEELNRRIESDQGNLQMSGTALILLYEENDQRHVVVLAASTDGLENSVSRLVQPLPMDDGSAFSDCVLHPKMALCPTGIEDEIVEYQLVFEGEADLVTEEPTDEETQDMGDEEEIVDEVGPPIDAEFQGNIGIDETVEGFVAGGQAHSWAFSEGPASVNISLQVGEDMDGVLELYDPDGDLLEFGDSGLIGEEERLDNVEIPTEGDYLIVVREFFGNDGNYTLSVEPFSLDSLGLSEQGEIVPDAPVAETLAEGEMHSWTFSIDGLTEITIVLVSDEDMDGVLALFDPDDQLLATVDETLSGEEEIIENFIIDVPGVYTIIVSDYADDGGSYRLSLELP